MEETCAPPAAHAPTAADALAGKRDHGRRGLLECMVWTGVGVLWTMSSGVPRSRLIGAVQALRRQVRWQRRADSASCRSASRYGYCCSLHPHMQGTVEVR